MTLRDWLSKYKITQAELARRVGVSPNTVYRWLTGEKRPGWESMERLAQETGGEVSADSFLPPRRSAA